MKYSYKQLTMPYKHKTSFNEVITKYALFIRLSIAHAHFFDLRRGFLTLMPLVDKKTWKGCRFFFN